MSDLEEIDQLHHQLSAHRRTLAILLRQVATHTEAYAPPAQISGIAEARTAIVRLKMQLRDRGIVVPDQAGDISSPTDVVPPRRATWRPEDRAAMLAKVRWIWIDGVLKQSLWNHALIALRLAERPDAVVRPYGLCLRVGVDEAPLPKGTTVQKIYAAQQGALLILGQPGSGKTTLLLELADTLLERAEQESAHPIITTQS
jgi:Cdc6-like AAA superfamily ATPase